MPTNKQIKRPSSINKPLFNLTDYFNRPRASNLPSISQLDSVKTNLISKIQNNVENDNISNNN